MTKYFCVADVHSFYDEMIYALNEAGYDKNNPDHIFVSCGDMFDRGSQSREVLEFLNSIPNEKKILICGNHEILMHQMIYGSDYPRTIDIKNGTWKTACDITQADRAEVIEKMRKNKEWQEYYSNTKYYATIGNYIITHAWIPCEIAYHRDVYGKVYTSYSIIPIEDWDKYEYEYDWEKTFTWANGMELWSKGICIEGKTIICGHWNVSWGHKNIHKTCKTEFKEDAIHEPFIDEGIVALDACTVVSHKVNCFVFEV